MSLSKFQKRKKSSTSFKDEWLNETVETDTPNSRNTMNVKLCKIFTYVENVGVVCMFCRDAKEPGEFLSGKIWDDNNWKLDFFKRHVSSKSHLAGVNVLRNRNPALRSGLLGMLLEDPTEK